MSQNPPLFLDTFPATPSLQHRLPRATWNHALAPASRKLWLWWPTLWYDTCATQGPRTLRTEALYLGLHSSPPLPSTSPPTSHTTNLNSLTPPQGLAQPSPGAVSALSPAIPRSPLLLGVQSSWPSPCPPAWPFALHFFLLWRLLLSYSPSLCYCQHLLPCSSCNHFPLPFRPT